MNTYDEWSGLADFLANMIEKYAGQINLDLLPNPDEHYKLERIREMYIRYMRLSTQTRQAARQSIRLFWRFLQSKPICVKNIWFHSKDD